MNKSNYERMSELQEDVKNLGDVTNSSNLSLLKMMSVAMTATAEKLMSHSELLEITDNVEEIRDLEEGGDRDILFERTRIKLNRFIGFNL